MLFPAQSEMDENQVQTAGADVDVPEDLRRMVAEDQEEEEDQGSVLGRLQSLQGVDLDAVRDRARAAASELRQAAERKCAAM